MAKAKYKVGNLVHVSTGADNSEFGVITHVVTSQNGYTYRVWDNEYEEESILSAYREIKKKTRKRVRARTEEHVTQ